MNLKNRRWLIIAALIVLLYGLLKTNAHQPNQEDSGVVPVVDNRATTSQIDPIEGIIEKLITCESGGRIDAVAYNDGGTGLDSRGILQFQLPTFKGYAKQFNLFPYAEAKELENLWTDPDAQRQLAKEMIKKDRKNLYHWRVCATRNHLL